MPALTYQQKSLLVQATKNVDSTHREFIRNLLIHMVDVSSWFHAVLIEALEYGVTFVCGAASNDTVGVWQHANKTITLNSNFLNIPTSKNLLANASHYTLRHEMTHAIDFKALFGTESNIREANLALILMYNDLANQLVNQLICVKSLHKVNKDVLNQISRLLIPLNTTTHGLEFMLIPESNFINAAISFFGSYADLDKGFPNYILKIFQADKGPYSLVEQTMNPLLASELFNSTSPIRKMIPVDISLLLPPQFTNEELALWKSLSIKQQQVLNILYRTSNFIVKNIPNDGVCKPKLEECLTLEKEDCLNEFLNCQSGARKLRSYWEIHAVLNENFEENLLKKTSFNNLCTTPASPQITTKDMLNNAVRCGVYSFADELSDIYWENKQIKYSAAWSLLTSSILVACSGYIEYLLSDEDDASIKLQIGIPMLIMFLTKVLKTFVSPKITLLAGVTASIPLVMSNSSTLANLAGGFVAAGTARFLAQSMGVGLGWEGPKTETPEDIEDREQQQNNNSSKKNS